MLRLTLSGVIPCSRIIFELLLAAAAGFRERAFHRAGDRVGVEDHSAFDVARCASDRLDE